MALSESIPGAPTCLHVLTGISDSSRWPELSESRMTTVIALARDWIDVIVLDVGFNLETDEEISSDLFAPRRNAATLTSLRDSDSIVAVCGADNVSLARFMRMYRELAERFPMHNLHAVLNRATNKKSAVDMTEILTRFGGIEPRAVLPVFAPRNNGNVIVDMEASMQFTSQVASLAVHLVPMEQAAQQERRLKAVFSRRFARQGN